MKTFFKLVGIGLIGLIIVILFNTFSAKSIQPEPFDQKIPDVSQSAVNHLSMAVQYKTISHKIEMMDNEAFDGLLTFIDSTYPNFTAISTKEIFGSHTLLYEWKGSDPKLLPHLYMGHIDVVPVEVSSKSKWHSPPFSGEINDGFIYGRGTLDDKACVIALLETAEQLIKNGFKPRHSIYFLFGQDEEIGGHEGAELVANKFLDENTEIGLIWDEGTIIGKDMVPKITEEVALIGIAEKGYVSFELSTEIEGGHSSIPESENSIGELTKAINALMANPFPYEISPPVQGFIDYMGPELPFDMKIAFTNTWLFKPLIFGAYAKTGSGRALIQTTVVPTIFKAGFKDNVVPVSAKAVVNCRILPGHSIESTLQYLSDVINNDKIKINPQETQVNPSRSTDYKTLEFRTIASAVKTVYPQSYSSPFLMLGATDSRHFEPVCKKIFKFAPFVYESGDLARLHGLNERIHIDNFKKGIQIYSLAIENLDKL